MIYADAREGLHVRFANHDGTRAGGKAAPVFRLRPAIRYLTDSYGVVVDAVEDGWERVVVIPHAPYARHHVIPFTPANAAQFVPCDVPLRKVTAADSRSNRSGSRRAR